uniref:18 kDa Sin3-associated polypeptide n=1 Tax=Romanomermis culicivorax TaxID=13658 RepID=A0A915JT82_ROMCU
MGEYNRGNVPPNELQIYTWMDCSLWELTSLIKEVNPDARRRGTVYDFAIVYPDSRGGYRLRDVGTTVSGTRGVDDSKTLQQMKFEIGDYMDVAVSVPGMRPPMRNRRNY